MGLFKRIFCIATIFVLFLGVSTKANALSFAGFAYQNAKSANVVSIRNYLKKGYDIDTLSPNGYTALCYAAAYNDYPAYARLRRLGADENHQCMQKVNQTYVQDLNQRYVATQNSKSMVLKSDDNTKYWLAGAAVAGTATAVALLAGGGGSSSDDTSVPPIKCPEGERPVDGVCQPCPDGTHLEGDFCVPDTECPEGQKYEDGKCVPIVCPPNTHLQGNICVADDIDIDNGNDDDLYGINSSEEDVYNLFSVPRYPDDEASINLKNKGHGNVYGVYGLGNVTNAYVVKKDGAGNVNSINQGVGTITINDEGSGNVYGLFSRIDDVTEYKEAINAAAWNEGVSYGDIDITHMGGGSSFGVFGDVRAYNALANYGGTSYGNLTIRGDGNIYGISGYAAATNAVSPFFGSHVEGNINLFSSGNGDVYGMMVSKDDIPGAGTGGAEHIASWFAFNAYSSGGDTVIGNINIHNTGNGNVYGMYGGEQLFNAMSYGDNGVAKGTINIVNLGEGRVYGMYSPEIYMGEDGEQRPIIANNSDNGAESVINIVNKGDGVTTGLRGGQGSLIENTGVININNLGEGTAVGIYGGAGSFIENSGKINIYRETYVDEETGETLTPQGEKGGSAYGIYAESGSYVVNNGEIVVTGAETGAGIYLENNATLENNGTISFNGSSSDVVQNGDAIDIYGDGTNKASVNLDDLGGEIILAQGGRFFAEELAGNMSVSEKIVLGSFADEYTLKGSLQADSVSDLNLLSKSAMFEASSKESDNGGYDVVLKRKNFDEVITDKNVSGFWEDNYNAENGSKIFDSLKKASSQSELNQKSANISGADVLPNFRRENALVFQNLSNHFNDNLFNSPNQNYIGGYKYIDLSMDKDGLLTGSDGQAHVAYGMLKGKSDNGIVYGLAADVAQLNVDYDNGASRDANIFGIWAPIGYDFGNGAQWFSKAYLGYVDGSYDRITDLKKYSSDITEYQYGLTNEVRYSLNLGAGFTFNPLAELNLFGVYSDDYDEGNAEGALNTNSHNDLSLEGGIGAYLSKKVNLSKDSNMTIQIGGVYYVEFLDPDDGFNTAMSGMNGKYRISHDFDKDRAVLSAKVRYDYKDITLYGNVEKDTSNNKSLLIDAGIQYKF